MKIIHISDTHGLHRELEDLPYGDIIIHSGDISMTGKVEEVMDFIDWFGKLDYKYKIFIAGNHDYCLDGKNSNIIQDFLPKNCFYLDKSGITIENIKFWGIPDFLSDDLGGNLPNIMKLIPNNTDVLITHHPPYKILDNANNIDYGCNDLLNAVLNICPKYHLFGHIHNSYGIKEKNRIVFVNASLVNEEYQLKNNPFILEL